MALLNIFISAVSDEFGDYREPLQRALTRLGVGIVIQEDFKAGGVPTLVKLDDLVRGCDAVVHLVGDASGADAHAVGVQALARRYPDLATRIPSLAACLAPGSPLLPYTQWEAWLALYHRKPLFVAKPSSDAPRGAKHARDEAQIARQARHLEALKRDHDIHAEIVFGGVDSLGLQVLTSNLLDQFVAAVLAHKQAQLEPGQITLDTVLALARRLQPDELGDLERAVKELKFAIGVALDVRAEGQRGANQPDAFVDEVMRRVAELTAAGQLQQGAESIDQALADLEQRSAQQREALLEASVRHGVLLRDADRVAGAVLAIAALSEPDRPAASDVFKDRLNEFYENGLNQGLNFSLAVAVALARLSAALARVDDEKGGAQVWLGLALTALGSLDTSADRLQEAVLAYQSALRAFKRKRVPLHWAMVQNNLGNTLWALGKREGHLERLQDAARAFRAALKEYTRERVPLLWATTQGNLGNVLSALGERENGTALLQQAAHAYRAALEEHTRENVPLEWAMDQNNLGTVLNTIGEREQGTESLQKAVQAYRAALEEFTRERRPMDWAMTQTNLGTVLAELGRREENASVLQDAVRAYRAALEEYTRDRIPLNWALAQSNLGTALAMLGEQEGNVERLHEALLAYRAALEERSRERVPPDWAETQANLGDTLGSLSNFETGTERLEEALQAYRAALEVFTPGGWPERFAHVTERMAILQALIIERQAGTQDAPA